jgi:transposase
LAIARSRTEWACRVQRARILLAYHANPSTYAVGEAIGVTHQTVQRCLDRAVRFGVMAALDDSPRPGKEPTITDAARAWVVSLACQKPKEVGYPHELWTTRLLARHVREAAETAGHREVAILRETEAVQPNVAIISYDEKPGIQAIASTAPDLPPQPRSHAGWGRDHEYKRHGTLSLLAGIDLLTGQVHACVENRHRSREFVGFLKKLNAAYPTDTAIKLILDNHSAHISKETRTWLATQPERRFTFVFTPKHGSWLNLVEGFFSKMARSVLRRIRVASKEELKASILAYLDDLNREPVIHTWTYKIDTAA